MTTLALAILTVGWSANMTWTKSKGMSYGRLNEVFLAIAFISTIISAFV